MPVIGLTGGIATGKSTVARMLADCGAIVLSADEASRAITTPGSAVLEQIARDLGPEYVRTDGTLDRKAMGSRIFSDQKARRKLEAITHPAILAHLRRSIAEIQSEHGADALIVVETPLLFEAGMESWFDAVATVVASPAVQMARLTAREGLGEADADARIRSQMELSEKAARSNFVIENDGGFEALSAAVERIVPLLRTTVRSQVKTRGITGS